MLSLRLLFSPSILALLIIFAITPSQAEYWLSESLYTENKQLFLLDKTDKHTNGKILSEVSLVQAVLNGQLQLGAKLNLEKENHTALINKFNMTVSLSPYWAIKLGRQKIHYQQNDLFQNSLTKNDERYDTLNYSQGLLLTHRLSYIQQSLLFLQKSKDISYHLNLGIPGYKVGPLMILLQQSMPQKNNLREQPLRGTIGSAVQFPLRIVPGDWQWAFQYASELNQYAKQQYKQKAWQMSLSWLGFIPQHKVGILFSHSDQYWDYSDDFNSDEQATELAYQWLVQQKFIIELAASTTNRALKSILKGDKVTLRISFEF